MEKRAVFGVGLALVALMIATGMALGDNLDLVVENQTGVDWDQLYMAPYPAESWGKNILEGEILRDGQARRIVLDDQESAYWDVMIPKIQAGPVIWRKLNVRALVRITFIYDGDEVRIEYE